MLTIIQIEIISILNKKWHFHSKNALADEAPHASRASRGAHVSTPTFRSPPHRPPTFHTHEPTSSHVSGPSIRDCIATQDELGSKGSAHGECFS